MYHSTCIQCAFTSCTPFSWYTRDLQTIVTMVQKMTGLVCSMFFCLILSKCLPRFGCCTIFDLTCHDIPLIFQNMTSGLPSLIFQTTALSLAVPIMNSCPAQKDRGEELLTRTSHLAVHSKPASKFSHHPTRPSVSSSVGWTMSVDTSGCCVPPTCGVQTFEFGRH